MTGQGPRFDVKPFLNQDEGQHFDRKSLFHGPPGKKQPRDRRGHSGACTAAATPA
jgi:hypothetical protein